MSETSIYVYIAELDGTGRAARAVFADIARAKVWLENLAKDGGPDPEWERVHTDRWCATAAGDKFSIERQRVRDAVGMIVAEEIPVDAWRK